MQSPAVPAESGTTPHPGARDGLGARIQQQVASLVGRPALWLAFFALAVTVPIVRAVRTPMPELPPVYGTIPDFSLTDHGGRPFGAKDLRGRVWVADFIFTRCPTICVTLTEKMTHVQHHARNLGQAFHIVSFTADPEHDTPERLAEYAQRWRASPRMWSFLTGSPEDIRTTVVGGMKLALDRDGKSDDPASILHGTHVVLVDEQMRIRGYYDVTEPGAVDRIVRDAGLLVNLAARG